MSEWLIRIIGKQHLEIDKHLLAQAVLAMARLLQRRQTEAEAKQNAESQDTEAGQ